jgi:hypothetical protein
LPDELDYQFLSDNITDSDVDELLEVFFGPGPFNYQKLEHDNFSFMLLGHDLYQTLFRVTRTGTELVY